MTSIYQILLPSTSACTLRRRQLLQCDISTWVLTIHSRARRRITLSPTKRIQYWHGALCREQDQTRNVEMSTQTPPCLMAGADKNKYEHATMFTPLRQFERVH